MPIESGKNYYRVRQKSPKVCKRIRFKGKDTPEAKKLSKKGIKFLFCYTNGKEGSRVQTILFDKSKWSLSRLTDWLKSHGFKYPTQREITKLRRMT